MAAILLIAAPGVYAAAQSRIGVNGGRPSDWPILSQLLAGSGLTQQGWLDFASHVGENWLPGMTPVPVDYPAQLGPVSGPFALTSDESVGMGQRNLHSAIMGELEKGGPVAVAGLSMGTLVIDRELAYLATAEDAPPPQDITFYVFGDPARGFGHMYMSGMTIPIIGQTFAPVPESQYDVVVVIEQWDGWANPPDRPWNLLAVLNAVMGAVYTVNGSNDHSRTSVDSMSEAVEVSRTTNARGGTTTTYMVPREELPLTRPLLQIGVPAWVVGEINRMLMPLIATGYSSMTPHLGPRIDHGQLVFTPPPAPPADPLSTDQSGVDGSEPSALGADSSTALARSSSAAALDVVAPAEEPQTSSEADAAHSVDGALRKADGQDLDAHASSGGSTPPSEVSHDAAEPVDPPKEPVDATPAGDETAKRATPAVEKDTDETRAVPPRDDDTKASDADSKSDSDSDSDSGGSTQ